MTKSEGQEVREAMDGPSLDHDALIDNMEARIAEEHARSSDSSESAAKVTEFLEDTGMNSQAFSWLKSILKKLPKKDGQHKAMDIIRSLKAGLPMIENHVAGQGTGEMQLEPDEAPDEAVPAPEEVEEAAPDEEAAEFNAEVDEAVGDDDGVVTPLDVGSAG